MNKIFITKQGLFLKEKKQPIPIDSSFSYYLNHYPKIEKGFTVKDLMTFLKKNENEVNLIFQSDTKGFFIDAYYQEMLLPIFKQDLVKIACLEFSWRTEVNNIKEFGKRKFELEESVNLSGLVKGKKDSYSLSFVHLNEIKDSTFKLNKNINFRYFEFAKEWDQESKNIDKIFFKGQKQFTLRDVIGAFLYEITFYGYPEDADIEADKVNKSIKDVKNGKTYTFDEIKLSFVLERIKVLKIKEMTKKNILRLENLQKEIAYLQNQLDLKGNS